MKLNQLFSFFNLEEQMPSAAEIFEREVTSICFDSKKIQKDSVFVAIKGTGHDGHDFINQAIENGAIALVVENKSKVPKDFPYLVAEMADTRAALDLLASRFYHYPSQSLFCFGVTGTNGKTSITYILEQIIAGDRKLAGVIGTVNHRVGEKIWEANMTTPDPVTLQSRLRDFLDEGAQVAVMEVSSHALEQKRVQSVNFNTVIFTNLTQDHLDYHQSMQNYFLAKQKLFTDMMWLSLKNPKFAVINIDDPYGRRIKVADEVVTWTYGRGESDFRFEIIKMDFSQTEFEIHTAVESIKAILPISGIHTVYNIVAACVAAMSFGITLQKSLSYLKEFHGVPGRLQKVQSSTDKMVFIDYAHTPDALENVLGSIAEIRKTSSLKSKIITVFGCGGDRDKTKRPQMAKIAAELSDFVIITSDNPRTENAESILDDVMKGLPSQFLEYERVVDREKAIQMAIARAAPGDVVLIAGKGHENYQIIGTEKRHFDDYEVARKYLMN